MAAAAAGGGGLIFMLLRRWYERGGGTRQAELFPGLHASCTSPSPRRSKPRHVVVVGAGIVGLSIANELARRGCKVTVLEKEMSAGTQATALSWAWINANSKQPKHYQRFNMLAMDLWDLMFPGYVRWCGSILLNENPKQEVAEYPRHEVSWSQVAELQPGVAWDAAKEGSGESACSYFPSEGVTEPFKVISEMLRRAEAREVQVVYGVTVTGFPWDVEGDVRGVTYVLHGSQGWDGPQTMAADVVVLSNGTGVEQLAKCAGFKVPLLHKPGFLAHTEPIADLVKRVVVSPNCHILQRENGSLVIGESKEAGGASSVAYAVDRYAHESFRSNMPPASNSDEQEDDQGLAELSTFGHRALAAAKRILPVIEEAKLSRVTCGYRPFPEDGLPVIGFCSSSCSTRSPGLYIAVMHSGITLAPLAGAAAALEIAEGLDLDLLSPYRVGRFTKVFRGT
uniref:FAD dependent oxidoreductase domain-containing protein n=1 Tax=Hanusia phi TaxID=3032 RepID=A0A7S0NFD7_9CRYP